MVLYLIEFLHQTTTIYSSVNKYVLLYLIEFLHQTTTRSDYPNVSRRCILLNFYIKPQHKSCMTVFTSVVSYWISTSNHNFSWFNHFEGSLYLIEFLHQTTTKTVRLWKRISCILLNFYIKPQLGRIEVEVYRVVSYWISTSNHNWNGVYMSSDKVVSYWISTSNHNMMLFDLFRNYVVSYWISTSNHNKCFVRTSLSKLYLIEFLHQTTYFTFYRPTYKLYLIEFLHQTTTWNDT